MKDFAELFNEIDATTKTTARTNALVKYFEQAANEDKIFTIALLTGKRPKRPVKVSLLRKWAAEITNTPDWLFEQSYHIAGDLAETISLLLSNPGSTKNKSTLSLTEWMHFLNNLTTLEDDEKRTQIINAWNSLDKTELFLFNKLITGGFRMGVSKQITIKALAKVTKQDESSIAHRLMGNWNPFNTNFENLIITENTAADDLSKPFPFFLAYPLEGNLENLGEIEHWQAEYKWDGIRGQIIVRNNHLFIWSRGEELITDKFP